VSADDIYNVCRVHERLITGGQPTEEQLREAAAEGCQAVINIAPQNPRYSLADEKTSVLDTGMLYWHLPVDWEAPTEADFRAFVTQMDKWGEKKLLVHCAANYRVSAFYSLYAMLRLGWTAEQADEFIAARWQPAEYPPWPDFIADIRALISRGEID
jgi:protein tyrosine phosphatase (PTP) superfamily phosphohydrolase (DUF442 family)